MERKGQMRLWAGRSRASGTALPTPNYRIEYTVQMLLFLFILSEIVSDKQLYMTENTGIEVGDI
jgi:hypothetical protein